MLGLTPQGDFSRGKLFELLVIGADQMGAFSKLSTLLSQHTVNILPSGGYYLLRPGTFIWTTFADFSKSKSPPEYVIRDLRRLSFVTEVKAKKLDGTNFDQFLFPVIYMGKFRSAIFSVEPLLGVERRLKEQFGPPGGVIMFEEGRQYVTETVRQLGEALPGVQSEILLRNVVGWLRTTGWGLFDFDDSKLAGSREIKVTVREPPIVVVPGLLKSDFVNGVTAGVVEAVYKRRMSLDSNSYDPKNRSLTLVFRDFEQ